MRIRNDLIRIELGNKKFDFQNLILNEYLKRFAQAQIDEQGIGQTQLLKQLKCCLFKFDVPFENITENSVIHNQDFNIGLVSNTQYSQEMNNNQVTIEYQYNNFDLIYDYISGTTNDDLTQYYGRKITAIGFNSSAESDESYETKFPVCAILDTSNYEIYLQENQELVITRRDIISSDAEFYSNSSFVNAPAHLAPYGTPQIIFQPNIYEDDSHTTWKSFYDNGYGIIYSVGLSNYKDYINEELIVGTDLTLNITDNEITIEGLENILSNKKLLPDNNIYPDSDLYPIKTNYKYLVVKYKVWQNVHSGTYENVISTPTDTGLCYYQAIPLSQVGNLNLKIKYERG